MGFKIEVINEENKIVGCLENLSLVPDKPCFCGCGNPSLVPALSEDLTKAFVFESYRTAADIAGHFKGELAQRKEKLTTCITPTTRASSVFMQNGALAYLLKAPEYTILLVTEDGVTGEVQVWGTDSSKEIIKDHAEDVIGFVIGHTDPTPPEGKCGVTLSCKTIHELKDDVPTLAKIKEAMQAWARAAMEHIGEGSLTYF